MWEKDEPPGWSRKFIIAIGNAGVCAAPTDPGGCVQVVLKEELSSCPSPATFTSLAGKEQFEKSSRIHPDLSKSNPRLGCPGMAMGSSSPHLLPGVCL